MTHIGFASYICKNDRCFHQEDDVPNVGETKDCSRCTKIMVKIITAPKHIDKTGKFHKRSNV